jgi:hypothetical protein
LVLAGGEENITFGGDPENGVDGDDGGRVDSILGEPTDVTEAQQMMPGPQQMMPGAQQMMSNSQMMAMMKGMMEGMAAPFMALAKVQTEVSAGAKRKLEEEEDEVRSDPVMIEVEQHHLRDDAHDTIDWVARGLRPYNGGDHVLFWGKMPRRSLPVIEDIKMEHLTKAPVNPNVIAKCHDRGAETTAKQWLSSNYSVEGKGGKIRADNDRSAGAFVLDYAVAKGPYEAVDAIHNYTMVLRQVRPEDWTGVLLQRTLHECRMFAHPRFSAVQQRDLIMEYFDQVLRYNAMMGRCRKAPMVQKEMLELAKELLFRKGVDGLASFISMEPYSRVGVEQRNNPVASAWQSRAGGSGVGSSGSGAGNSGAMSKKKEGRMHRGESILEKVRRCCTEFNSVKGCSKTSSQCRFKHLCTAVDEVNQRVCWSAMHNIKNHKW